MKTRTVVVVAADGVDLEANPELHTLHCALMPPCVASGYGIYVENGAGVCEFYKLDKKGGKLAESLLESTTKANGIEVEVGGEMRGDTIKVKTLAEAVT